MLDSIIEMVSAGLALGLSFRLLGLMYSTLHRNIGSITKSMSDFMR